MQGGTEDFTTFFFLCCRALLPSFTCSLVTWVLTAWGESIVRTLSFQGKYGRVGGTHSQRKKQERGTSKSTLDFERNGTMFQQRSERGRRRCSKLKMVGFDQTRRELTHFASGRDDLLDTV